MKTIRNVVALLLATTMLAFGLAAPASAATAPTNVRAVSTTDTSIRLGWTGFGGTYKIYKDGVYVSGADGTNTEETISGLTKCTIYTFQVEAVDGSGAAKSAPVSLKTTGTCPVSNVTKINDSSFVYTGIWYTSSVASLHNGDNHYTPETAASWTYTFSGTQVQWFGEKNTAMGIVAVSIDGGPEQLVDPYATSRSEQNLLYTSAQLTSGTHTIKIRNTGTKNAASGGYFISADRIDITNFSSAPTPTPTPISGVPAPGNWTQVFGDEFNDNTVDTTKWRVNWYGEGNTMNKVQNYARNVSESGGNLNLKLESTTAGALVHTDFTGGYKLPVGSYVGASIFFPATATGVCANWPAWWANTLASEGWPKAGEHDIAEVLSGQLTVNYHSPSGAHNQGAVSGSWCGSWHEYGLHRKDGSADVYWDGVKVKSYTTDDSGNPEMLILNHGVHSSNTVVGAEMKVDWVRAYTPAL